MKKILYSAFLFTLMISCSEPVIESKGSPAEQKIGVRTSHNTAAFESGLISSGPFSSGGEIVYIVNDDFEVRPYGDTDWYPHTGFKKIRVRCKCVDSCGNCGAQPPVGDTITCYNQCTGCACEMHVRITGVNDDIAEGEYFAGVDIRADN